MRRRFRFFLILAIATAHLLRAQQPSFRIFSTQDGLVRNWVTKIHRDSKGYLWFCTVEGISLFDGYRFTNFSTRDGLPSRLVSDMIETRQGDYWFATTPGWRDSIKTMGRLQPSTRFASATVRSPMMSKRYMRAAMEPSGAVRLRASTASGPRMGNPVRA